MTKTLVIYMMNLVCLQCCLLWLPRMQLPVLRAIRLCLIHHVFNRLPTSLCPSHDMKPAVLQAWKNVMIIILKQMLEASKMKIAILLSHSMNVAVPRAWRNAMIILLKETKILKEMMTNFPCHGMKVVVLPALRNTVITGVRKKL